MEIEALPPPVPPKDTPTRPTSRMSQAPTSASKRKRDEYSVGFSDIDDEHSAKKYRLSPPLGDTDASESTPRQSALRRKKGVNNLSSLNLRHQVEQDASLTRESKFQEGSLSDKPSENPPSAFTRIVDRNVGSLTNMDTLMTDYHNGMPTPGESVEDLAHDGTQPIVTSQPSGLYRFGRKIANTFKPMNYFNKMFHETKEELMAKNSETARRQLQKEEAEKQYETLKRSGQIPKKRPSWTNFGSISQRDSGIEMVDDERTVSALGSFRAHSRADSSAGASDADGEKTVRGRFHLKRPSISNIRKDLKRVRSDISLFGTQNRDSSASLSPVKTEDILPELRQSSSKVDLRKHHKLKKRVSDLESKLQQARRELEGSLIEASPVYKPGNKFERFHTGFAAKRFVPGLLPSLPSERLLEAQTIEQNMRSSTGQLDHETSIEEHVDEDDFTSEGSMDKNATIRASRANAYVKPRHINDLFYEDDTNTTDNLNIHNPATTEANMAETVAQTAQRVSNGSAATPTAHIAITESVIVAVQPPAQVESSPVEEAVADSQVITQPARKKKRKSDEGYKSYKPGDKVDDEEDELIHKKKAPKKRKSTEKNKALPKEAVEETAAADADLAALEPSNDPMLDASFETPRRAASRLSIDSTHSLEPVYEEEEETTSVPMNFEPPKPTAIATPARFSRMSRSVSPVKRGAEETVITRAAYAAKKHPGRRSRSRSPIKANEEYEWPDDVF